MSERANFQSSYLKRYLLLAGVCIPLSMWFLYDGFIGYPKKIEYIEAYAPLRELATKARAAEWQTIAKEKGWPLRIPEDVVNKKADEFDSTGQFVYASMSFLAGFIALLYYLRSRGTWVDPTPTGLTTSWGQAFDFKDVVKLDKKKWETKGIAKATYRDKNLTRVFVFDDFKYDREPLGEMLRSLEKKLSRDQIVGGPPEPPRELSFTKVKAEESTGDEKNASSS
jgi:hypothetical protein